MRCCVIRCAGNAVAAQAVPAQSPWQQRGHTKAARGVLCTIGRESLARLDAERVVPAAAHILSDLAQVYEIAP